MLVSLVTCCVMYSPNEKKQEKFKAMCPMTSYNCEI